MPVVQCGAVETHDALVAGQMPVRALTSDDLPAALAPSKARPMPAVSVKEMLERRVRSPPGTVTVRSSTDSFWCGRGSATASAAGAAVAFRTSRRRPMPWRAATSCFQLASATSIGASARPIMIDEAIMMPPEACSMMTR